MENNRDILWQVILNPHAGCGKGSHDREKIVQLLNDAGFHFELSVSEYPGQVIELAEKLQSQGNFNFIVAGGDGTLNEVVNGLFSGDNNLSGKTTIGMFPVGTGNDWIKTFGIPDNYEEAIKIIKAGRVVDQNVGEIRYTANEKTGKRFFVNITGFGFDAVVAKNANRLKERGASVLRVYLQSLASSYFSYRSVPTIIHIDGEEMQLNLFSASIGLGKYNGGGMMQVPDANPLNSQFHVTLIRKIGIWGILTNIRGLYTGKFVRDYRVSTHTGTDIEITSDQLLPGEADGESLGNARFSIKMIPRKLTVICGPDVFLKYENKKPENKNGEAR
jgi:YegS/Rv2252/BmrU family lipid kinase